MAAMLMNVRLVLILSDSPALRCAIWLWIYCKKVRPDHRPIFIIVVSSAPVSLSAMAPPARRECGPTRSASMPFLCRCSAFTALRKLVVICRLVICDHVFDVSSQTSHRRFLEVPLFARIWWTLYARALTGHDGWETAWWWIVWPILPFFWLVIFSVHDVAVNSVGNVLFRGRMWPSLKKPTSQTLNCTVRVARFCMPLRVATRGFVYSPTRSK